jgi:hypothetical protein
MQDPIGLAGGVTLYEYAGSNPGSFDDPFGLECGQYGNCVQSGEGKGGQVNPRDKGGLERPFIGEDVFVPMKVPAVGGALAGVLVRVGLNRLAGRAAETWLAKTFGGRAASLATSRGWRHLDNLTAAGVAQEAKTGRTFLTGRVKEQIARDEELLRTSGSGVTAVEWHFFPGLAGSGPSGPLRQALTNAGIGIVEHATP